MVEITLVVVVILLLALIALVLLVYRGRRIEPNDLEPAISKVWRESGLDKTVGELTAHAKDIRDTHTSIEQMLRVPKERASLGELSLETILSDQLSPRNVRHEDEGPRWKDSGCPYQVNLWVDLHRF